MSLKLQDILLLKTWRIYRLSPLHHFKQDSSTLSSYAKLLVRFLRSEHGQHGKLNAEITSTSSESQSSSTKCGSSIIVAANQEREATETSCIAIICSIGSLQNGGLEPGFVDFPLLLVQGITSPLCNSVISWIQLKFDCCITPLSLSSSEMISVLYNYLSYQGKNIDKLNKAIELVFEVPSTIQGLKHITINFDVESIRNLSVSASESNPQNLLEHLFSYYFENFKIDLNKLSLVRIGTPLAYLNYDGKSKILSNPIEYLEQLTASIERNHIAKNWS